MLLLFCIYEPNPYFTVITRIDPYKEPTLPKNFTSPIFFTPISLEKIKQNRTKSASKYSIDNLYQLRNYKVDLPSKLLIFTKDNSII